MTKTTTDSADSGLLVVDKPSGWTSHQVVGRVRRLIGTRKVGHAGTLDPMATGVLLVGVNRATRLLGHLSGRDKSYDATIRLGQATFTDDAEGEIVSETPVAELDPDLLALQIAALTGDIMQTPSTVSAIKVDGQRAYARARRGEPVELRARPVTVSSFEVRDIRAAHTRTIPVVDVDVTVECSTGTYVRSLARDLGAALGVGGHLTALRRTRVGPFGLAEALPPSVLTSTDPAVSEPPPALLPLGDVAARVFPTLFLDADQARDVRYGRTIGLNVQTLSALLYEGELFALYEPGDRGDARPVAVFVT